MLHPQSLSSSTPLALAVKHARFFSDRMIEAPARFINKLEWNKILKNFQNREKSGRAGQQLASLRLTLGKIFHATTCYSFIFSPVVTDFTNRQVKSGSKNQIFSHVRLSGHFPPRLRKHLPPARRRRSAAKITPAQVAGTSNLKYLK